MTAKHSKPVRTLASLCLIPKALMAIPKDAVEAVKVFAEDVKDEMDTRSAQVRAINHKEA